MHSFWKIYEDLFLDSITYSRNLSYQLLASFPSFLYRFDSLFIKERGRTSIHIPVPVSAYEKMFMKSGMNTMALEHTF
jgi:hypothetical protein